jgi:exodeoxyribonuclease VIII
MTTGTTGYTTGVYANIPEAEYHALPSLSSSGARLLLPEFKGSPKKFQWAKSHPRVSRTFDVGTATHAKVLGVGSGTVEYPPEHLTPSGNVSTKAATVEWEAEQRAAGLTPVSPDEVARVDEMSEAVLNHATARPYLEVCLNREMSVFAEIDGVPVRARFDGLSDETRNGTYALDLKTTEDATVDGFTKSVKNFGYDVQDAWYEDVHEAATGRGIDEFLIIAVEKSAPFEVAVHRIPTMWVAMGRKKGQEARRIYSECMASGNWPGYTTEVTDLDPPAWAVIDYEMRYESEIRF